MPRVTVRYYALLRETAGRSQETLPEAPATPAALYALLQSQHGFPLAQSQLQVAVNAEFSDWQRALADGDEVVFIPPVAGG